MEIPATVDDTAGKRKHVGEEVIGGEKSLKVEMTPGVAPPTTDVMAPVAIKVDAAQHRGHRSSQEDRYDSSHVPDEHYIISVFDGHGGNSVSDYLSCFFHNQVRSELKKKEATPERALKAAVNAMDEKLVGKHVGQGSTLCSVMVRDKTIISTNVGDCRAVLCREGGAAFDLTRDHTPYDPIEKARIEQAGLSTQRIGKFDKDGKPIPGKGCVRVNHGITLARTIDTHRIVPVSPPSPRSRALT